MQGNRKAELQYGIVVTHLCNWIRNKEIRKFLNFGQSSSVPKYRCVWVSHCKKGCGHRVNLINVLKSEQSLRDRGSTASRGTCGITFQWEVLCLQKEPLGRSRGMQQEWVEILEKSLAKKEGIEVPESKEDWNYKC